MLTIIITPIIFILTYYFIYRKITNEKIDINIYKNFFAIFIVGIFFGLFSAFLLPSKTYEVIHEYDLITVNKHYLKIINKNDRHVKYLFVYNNNEDKSNSKIVLKENLIIRQTDNNPLYVLKEKVREKKCLINLFSLDFKNKLLKHYIYLPNSEFNEK